MKTLYVGNLPFQTTEQDLVNWFLEAGVSGPNVKLIRDQMSGQLRGFGFVEVTNNEQADHAIEALNGQDFQGRFHFARDLPKGQGRLSPVLVFVV